MVASIKSPPLTERASLPTMHLLSRGGASVSDLLGAAISNPAYLNQSSHPFTALSWQEEYSNKSNSHNLIDDQVKNHTGQKEQQGILLPSAKRNLTHTQDNTIGAAESVLITRVGMEDAVAAHGMMVAEDNRQAIVVIDQEWPLSSLSQTSAELDDDMIACSTGKEDKLQQQQQQQQGLLLSPSSFLSDPEAGILQAPKRSRRWLARRKTDFRIAWEHRLLSYQEIPDWMRDKSLILGSYCPHMSVKQALYSLFIWHNETFNVWSHLAATSSATHLFYVVGQEASDLLWKLDHTAIAVGATTAFFPICFYAFACHISTAITYVVLTCALASGVIATSMMDIFHTPRFRPVRACVQMSFPMYAMAPLIHATRLLVRYPDALQALILVYAAMVIIIVLGTAIFATRACEKMLPAGRVELVGSSHNVMHVMVVVSHVVFVAAGYDLWLFRQSSEGGQC
ncbi:hypothetical protein CEUSTIGMA_g1568.t1 [Chlamydomonas eustigma]|uniref:Uncharacterized protein n=1 Tax=Chlamydomonas eustigma TaxID=1157962 RepID=A0A250WTR0_9CHLO|nr:hypothetical protein CEUSTIGMA_g1568.t1 [Chlamydomonas eustigma]|eukprot:GAX74119.1 hypothetical protein CEUSTIGMA_g1568.t1 [Chlamydomonas eustigma]